MIHFRGSLFLNLYAVGLALTSATFMLAVVNLIPGITFIMATSFGYVLSSPYTLYFRVRGQIGF